MDKILLIGDSPVASLVQRQLKKYEVRTINNVDFTKNETYQNIDVNTNVIVSLVGPDDVDLAMQALFENVREKNIKIKHFIFLSAAGIDKEVDGNLKYNGIANVTEFLRQQRYAIKIIDEEEIPYTIFRLVDVIKNKNVHGIAINEGETVPAGVVSYATIADFIIAAIVQHKYVNQSIALIDDEEK